MGVELLVNFGQKIREGLLVIAGPVFDQEVVENDIDDQARETAAFGGEEFFGLVKGGVGVGEAVDGAVEADALDDGGREVSGEAFRGAFDKVAQQIADARGGIGRGEMEMGEEVQVLE